MNIATIGAIASSGGAAANPYIFPTAGAVDTWNFDVASGNIISEVKAQTYTVTEAIGGQFVYSASGPNSLVGLTHDQSNGGYVRLASQTDTDFDIGSGESFVLMVQFKANNNTPADDRVLLDFGSAGANTSGIFLILSATFRLTMYVVGAGGSGFVRTDTSSLTDGTFYTARIVFDRSSASVPKMYVKEEGGSETDMTVSGSLNPTTCGAITITTDPMSFYNESDTTGNVWWGQIYQAAFAKGTTYDCSSKP